MESSAEADHLTGDWGGGRTKLVERGVHIQLGYVGECLGTVSGGLRRGTVYEGLVEAAIELDFAKLFHWWDGFSFRTSALFPHGSSPTQKLVGEVQAASNIDAYDSIALYELWLQQDFWNGRLSIRAGQLLAETDFALTEASGALINSAFGWPTFISTSTRNTGPAFYRAAPGIFVRAAPRDDLFMQVGAYDGDTFDQRDGTDRNNQHGLNFRISGNEGVLTLMEIGWRLHPETNSTGLPGTYRFGGWIHTGTFEDLDDPQTHPMNYGIYVAGEQQVWHPTDDTEAGLSVFVRAGFSPEDRNRYPLCWETGLQHVGLFPGRPRDIFAAGVGTVTAGHDLREGERQSGERFISDREWVVELTYQIAVRPWLTVQPDLQWIHHPGGSAAIDDAILLGLRARLTF